MKVILAEGAETYVVDASAGDCRFTVGAVSTVMVSVIVTLISFRLGVAVVLVVERFTSHWIYW